MIWGDIFSFFPVLFDGIVEFCRSFYNILFTEFNFIGIGTLTLFDFIFSFTVGLIVYRIIVNIVIP